MKRVTNAKRLENLIGGIFMVKTKTIDELIKELQNTKSKHQKIMDDISNCDEGISLLRKNSRLNLEKKPKVEIRVEDDYTDHIVTAAATLFFREPSPELTASLIQIFEDRKQSLKEELSELERKYLF